MTLKNGIREPATKVQTPPPIAKSVRKPPAKIINKSANGHSTFDLNNLLYALQAMKVGDFSVRMAGDHLGIEGKIADAFNEIVAANERMAKQLENVGQVVGREGKTRQRVRLGLSGGAWGRWNPPSTR